MLFQLDSTHHLYQLYTIHHLNQLMILTLSKVSKDYYFFTFMNLYFIQSINGSKANLSIDLIMK